MGNVPRRARRGQLKRDGTRVKTRFRLSTKRTSLFKLAGASVQSTTGSRTVRISGSNAGYTMFRGSVKGTGYPLHLNRRGRQFSRLLAAEVCGISGSNAGYTMFRGSVKGTGYPLHSPVSPSLPLHASRCAITFQLEYTAVDIRICPLCSNTSTHSYFYIMRQHSHLKQRAVTKYYSSKAN